MHTSECGKLARYNYYCKGEPTTECFYVCEGCADIWMDENGGKLRELLQAIF